MVRQKPKNIYIASYELGASNMSKGISFNELCGKLKNEYTELNDDEFRKHFEIWFYSNFYVNDAYMVCRKPNKDLFSYFGRTDCKNIEGFLSGEAYQKYLEYKELEQARKSSRTANWFAVAAILLSFVSFCFAIRSNVKNTELQILSHQNDTTFQNMVSFKIDCLIDKLEENKAGIVSTSSDINIESAQ